MTMFVLISKMVWENRVEKSGRSERFGTYVRPTD